jgi:hypothetical protein
MAKTETIKWNDFFSGAYKEPKQSVKEALRDVVGIVSSSGLLYKVISMEAVMAATADATFGNVHRAIMAAFDCGAVIIIIVSGGCWSLGHRSKAIEILIGVCCGYVLARHAIDIRDFLKGI